MGNMKSFNDLIKKHYLSNNERIVDMDNLHKAHTIIRDQYS